MGWRWGVEVGVRRDGVGVRGVVVWWGWGFYNYNMHNAYMHMMLEP